MNRNLIPSLILTLYSGICSASAMPNELREMLKPLEIVHQGTCSFKVDNSDPKVPCVVFDGDKYFYVIVLRELNSRMVPMMVKRITKDTPEEQVDLWTDPVSLI